MALESHRLEVTQEGWPRVTPSLSLLEGTSRKLIGDKHRVTHFNKRPMHRAQITVFSHTGIDISTN